MNAIERKQRYVTVTGTGNLAPAVINALAALGVRVSDVEAQAGNLEDAFLKLTKQGALAKGYQLLEQKALLRTEREDLRRLLRRR